VSSAPDITVVIPTHERAASLRRTLEALIGAYDSGRNPDFGVVVVDDGSRDSTPEVVSSVAARANLPIRYQRLPANRGSYSARNVGASLAGGSLILFLDDDIIVGPDHVARHATAHHNEGPRTIILGDRWEFSSDAVDRFGPGHLGRFRLEVEDWIRGGVADLGTTPSGRNRTSTIHTGDMSIARETLEEVGPFDEEFRWIGDQDYALRSLEKGIEIVWDPEIKTLHDDPRWSFRHYCGRIEDGSRAAPLLATRHPSAHGKAEMIEANSELSRSDPIALTIRKLAKAFLARPRPLRALHVVADHSSWLPYSVTRRLYWAILGVHVFKGVREGLDDERRLRLSAEKPPAWNAGRPQ
jgi:glycosyltransferase involved in cell wall biosynthesis